MKISHAALWVKDLEVSKNFYLRYFQGRAKEKYSNPAKGFESYWVRFEDGCALEIMRREDVAGRERVEKAGEYPGWAHLAFSVGGREKVDELTARLRSDGYRIVDGPRTTGDGCYESVVLDPEGNRVEITE